MNQPLKVSIAIIVRNETSNLMNCLNSVKALAGQIVVVDTGSDDETTTIATRLGAEVYYYQWDENFSNARNFALAHCRFPWILSIDADEVFDIFSLNLVLDQMIDPKIGGINLKILNSLGEYDYTYQSEHRYTRLFRRSKEIRYKGRIHEQIRESIENAGFEVFDSELSLYHYGYKTVSNDKKIRNRDLLNLEVIDNPNDSWLLYHLAATEFSLGNLIEASDLFMKVINSNLLSQEQTEFSKIRLAQAALSKDDFIRVENWLDFESNNANIEGFRLFILAANLTAQKRLKEALELYDNEIVKSSGLVDKLQLEDFINTIQMILAQYNI